MNTWYEKSATAILRGDPDLDTDAIRVSRSDKGAIAATLTIERDGSNSHYSAFTYIDLVETR